MYQLNNTLIHADPNRKDQNQPNLETSLLTSKTPTILKNHDQKESITVIYIDRPTTPGPKIPVTTPGPNTSVTYIDRPITLGQKTSVTTTYIDRPITLGPKTPITCIDRPITLGPKTPMACSDKPITLGPKTPMTCSDKPITLGPKTSITCSDRPITLDPKTLMTCIDRPITLDPKTPMTCIDRPITLGPKISVTPRYIDRPITLGPKTSVTTRYIDRPITAGPKTSVTRFIDQSITLSPKTLVTSFESENLVTIPINHRVLGPSCVNIPPLTPNGRKLNDAIKEVIAEKNGHIPGVWGIGDVSLTIKEPPESYDKYYISRSICIDNTIPPTLEQYIKDEICKGIIYNDPEDKEISDLEIIMKIQQCYIEKYLIIPNIGKIKKQCSTNA